MSIRDKLTQEQWKALFNSPFAASTFVASASGGGFDMVKEIFTAGKIINKSASQTGGSGYGELVDNLLATIKEMTSKEVKANTLTFQTKDPIEIRAEAKQIVVDGAAVASTLSGGDDYKRWILEIADQVAKTKTGGFLGIGNKSVVDEKEQAALNELKTLLGF